MVLRVLLPTLLLGCLTTTAHGGLYAPDEPFDFDIDEKGLAKPLAYENFQSIYAALRSLDKPGDPLRLQYETRVQKRREQGLEKLNPTELAGFTADLIRLRKIDEAITLLEKAVRDRRQATFPLFANLAHCYASSGNRSDAYSRFLSGLSADFPKTFPGRTEKQLAWVRSVERKYVFVQYRARKEEEEEERRTGRIPGVQRGLDVLFPYATPPQRLENPLRFFGPSGKYEPGMLDEKEAAKLPPDALAIVQQMVLWAPDDTRLYWLLGELFNATGELAGALKIFDACVDAPRSYGNAELKEHRNILGEYLAEKTEKQQRDRQETKSRQRRQLEWILAIALALVLVFGMFQWREWRRRRAARLPIPPTSEPEA